MIMNETTLVSVPLELLITKDTPAVIVPTESVPTVPPIVLTERRITEDAVTFDVGTVTVPATSVAVPTTPAAPVERKRP